ncbi:MAG: DNA polymerase III subunit delta' [Thermoguttaceae bacterium]|nr:DNA polymerase III subunit delta' [Thermoguttaceae bacterium]
MSWFGIHGHDEIVSRFQRAIRQGRIASTFLFLGPSGIGKRMFAERLAMTLLCTRNDPGLMEPCGKCESCRQMLAGTHPDLLRVSKPEDRAFIPIDLFIGPKEARRQVGLCAELAKKPIYEKRKIAIIDDADFLNIEGANSMLKTLEEPPKNSVLILLGTTASRQLPTIRSRCQIIRFKPLETDVVEEILREKRAEQLALAESVSQTLGKKKTPKKAASAANILSEDLIPLAAAASGGSVQEALALADEGFWDFRSRFLDRLASGVHDRIALGKEIDEQLELVGKVPARRRARLRVIVETAADFYRRLAFWLAGNPPSDPLTEKEWRPILTRAAETWPFDAEGAAFAALKTSDYLELIQRNVHQPTLLDAWLDELVRLYAADPTALGLTPWGLKPNP